jgi:hypothetical protein
MIHFFYEILKNEILKNLMQKHAFYIETSVESQLSLMEIKYSFEFYSLLLLKNL